MFFRKQASGDETRVKVSGGTNPLMLLLAFIVLAVVVWFLATWQAGNRQSTSFSAKVLSVESLMSLVTSRVTTQVYYHQTEGSALLGLDESVVLGEVEIDYGVDLSQMKPSDIKSTEDRIDIVIPPVEVTSIRLRDGSLRVMNKSTLLQKLAGPRTDERYNDYIAGLKKSAQTFADKNALASQTQTAKQRIQQHYSALFPDKTVSVRTQGDPEPITIAPTQNSAEGLEPQS